MIGILKKIQRLFSYCGSPRSHHATQKPTSQLQATIAKWVSIITVDHSPRSTFRFITDHYCYTAINSRQPPAKDHLAGSVFAQALGMAPTKSPVASPPKVVVTPSPTPSPILKSPTTAHVASLPTPPTFTPPISFSSTNTLPPSSICSVLGESLSSTPTNVATLNKALAIAHYNDKITTHMQPVPVITIKPRRFTLFMTLSGPGV
ncbi:hypothetical protein F0562_030310 [Nyssa sinensis]|uniref:Uncharacterized protein n=1 Tax=Nyssa sinensis TaxID=561372 RepID=A0A5J5B0M3_9ASTE|nr:hypothetical protein F0562_030310 [Nyssa sinensis]